MALRESPPRDWWHIGREMLENVANGNRRRYAIGFPADQTIVYLCVPGRETTVHKEALLFHDFDAAIAIARLHCRKGDKHALNWEHDISVYCECCGWFVERVEDEAEFCAREDTW